MAIVPADLIEFASEAAKPEASEAQLRAAVSRAYYAAFHMLAPFAGKLPRSRSCPDDLSRLSHQELQERLIEWRTDGISPRLRTMTATKDKLWRAVSTACRSRIIADYRIGSQVNLSDAQTQIERVKQISRLSIQIQAEIERSASSTQASNSACER